MRVTKYQMLLKVLEFGSLSRAADYYNYSQSAVSQMIQSLENELGIKVIHRSRSGVHLTADGEQLLPFFYQIQSAQDLLFTKVFELKNMEAGIIRIAAFTSVACHTLPPLIQAFKEKYPNIEFYIKQGDYTETERWIKDGVVDFGVVKLPSPLKNTPLFKDQMLVVLPVGHPLADLEAIPAHLLESEHFIMFEPDHNDTVLKLFKSHSISPQIDYRVRDDYTMMAMVEKDLGIAILPELVLNRTPYDIVTRPIDPPLYRSLAIANKPNAHLSIASQVFIESLKDYFKGSL